MIHRTTRLIRIKIRLTRYIQCNISSCRGTLGVRSGADVRPTVCDLQVKDGQSRLTDDSLYVVTGTPVDRDAVFSPDYRTDRLGMDDTLQADRSILHYGVV